MDYSFIDKLLERYWQCATSLEEEEMLKAFFRQKEIPQRFEQYRSLFNYEDLAASEHLGADFDEKMIRMVEQPVVRARRIPFAVRFRPFFKSVLFITGIAHFQGCRSCCHSSYIGKCRPALVQKQRHNGSRLQLCHL